jgi:DNA-binding LacI/PurR family transcriptional regulator
MYDINKEIEVLKTLRAKMVDGIIIMPATDNLIDGENLKRSRIPIIALDREIQNVDVDIISVDYEKTNETIVDFLARDGHRNIGYIDRKYDQSHSLARRSGFEKALEKNDLQLQRSLIVRSPGFEFSDGYKAAELLLEHEATKPSAVICPNDIIAIGAMKKFMDSGMNVPQDISVVGYGDIPVSEFTLPGLTTLKYPGEEISRAACEILLKKIEDPLMTAVQRILIRGDDLIMRASTMSRN